MTTSELTEIRLTLGLGPVDMGRAMGVSYDTYKSWQSGYRPISSVAARCAELLIRSPEIVVLAAISRTSCQEKQRKKSPA